MPLSTGTMIGVCEVREYLGHGGFSEAYRVWNRNLSRYEVMKIPIRRRDSDYEKDSDRVESFSHFLEEGSKQGPRYHSNIVQVYASEYVLVDGESVPVHRMEFMAGGDLGGYARSKFGGCMPWDELSGFAEQIVSALRYLESIDQDRLVDKSAMHGRIVDVSNPVHAHPAMPICHLDIKPANIFLDKTKRVAKLGDFGESTLIGGTSHAFTLAFASPEQISQSNQTITHKSDIYSFGVTLFYLLSGRTPFGNTEDELKRGHLYGEIPSVRTYCPHVTEGVDALIQSMMAKDPNHRPSAAQVANALKSLSLDQPKGSRLSHDDQPKGNRSSGAISEETERQGKRIGRWSVLGIVGVTALVLLAVMVAIGLQPNARNLLTSARAAMANGREPLALKDAQRALELDQKNPEALRMVAQLELRSTEAGSLARARSCASRLLELPNPTPTDRLLIAECEMRSGQPDLDGVLDQLEAAILMGIGEEVRAESGVLLYNLAVTVGKPSLPGSRERWQRIAGLAQKLSVGHPPSFPAMKARIYHGMATNSLRDALRVAQSLTELDPVDPEAFYLLGKVHWLLNDFNSAEESWREAERRCVADSARPTAEQRLHPVGRDALLGKIRELLESGG